MLDIFKPKKHINHRTNKKNYKISIFDTKHQRDHVEVRAIQFIFKFSHGVADIVSHALVLTRKIISVSSEGINLVYIVS